MTIHDPPTLHPRSLWKNGFQSQVGLYSLYWLTLILRCYFTEDINIVYNEWKFMIRTTFNTFPSEVFFSSRNRDYFTDILQKKSKSYRQCQVIHCVWAFQYHRRAHSAKCTVYWSTRRITSIIAFM